MEIKKLQKWIEAVNTYYAFAILVYAVLLYAAGYIHMLFWVALAATPLLAGWGGYLIKSFVDRRRQRHGFEIVADSMSYEIGPNNKYTLRYNTTLRPAADHLMVYPIGYQWSGQGVEGVPKITGAGQQLLAPVASKKGTPYTAAAVSTEGNWHYWFIAFNPPVHTNETVNISYTQRFHDKKAAAKPYLYYFVRTNMQKLELSVKFPAHVRPHMVTGSYIKPSDPNRPYAKPGVDYDPSKQWATWVIQKPKRGYCYRIHWQ